LVIWTLRKESTLKKMLNQPFSLCQEKAGIMKCEKIHKLKKISGLNLTGYKTELD